VAVDQALHQPGDVGPDLRRHGRHEVALSRDQSPAQAEALTGSLPLRAVARSPAGQDVPKLVQRGPRHLDQL
jgi:hypothetical protein